MHFLDFGNKSEAEAIKQLPDSFKKIPIFAVRLVVNQMEEPLEEGREFSIKIIRKVKDYSVLDFYLF